MKRNVDINEISDGKLYTANDMVKAGCDGCKGCSACCAGMGDTVVLDPLDIYRLTSYLKCSFEQLLVSKIALGVVDGIILPHLNMNNEAEKCGFLDEAGRCSVHSARPGICRLFPLGRIYQDGGFKYFLQVYECPKENKTKVKVKQWLGIEQIKDYEKFVCDWHYMLKALEDLLVDADEGMAKKISMYVLNEFYIKSYKEGVSVYEQLSERISNTKVLFGLNYNISN